MRKALGILAATVLAMGIAGASNATTMAFGGTITMQLGTLPGLVMPASGVATINGTGGLGHINTLAIGAGLFTASSTFSVNSGTVPYVQFTGIANNAGAFTGSPLAGTMGFSGAGRICVILPPPCAVVVPLQAGPATGLGIGGTATATGYVNVTMVHQLWTAGLAGGFTVHNAASGNTPVAVPGLQTPLSNTATPGGVAVLVTATHVFTNLAQFPELPIIAALQMQFVPEPGTLLLLLAGVGGLALLGRRRIKN